MAVEYDKEKTEDQRHWYQKKRYGIPLAIFAIYLVVGSIFGAFDEEPAEDATEQQNTESSSEATGESTGDSSTQPEPEPEPAGPEYEDLGEFDVLTLSGTGSDVFDVPSEIVYAAIELKHDGSRNFIVEGLDANNDTTELLANEIGVYQGTVAFGLGARDETLRISVEADGEWVLTIKPLYTQPNLVSSGSGDGVYLFEGNSPVFDITHEGERNFIVQQIPLEGRGELLVNEIGVYSGSVPGVSGKSLIVIQADGSWQISPR